MERAELEKLHNAVVREHFDRCKTADRRHGLEFVADIKVVFGDEVVDINDYVLDHGFLFLCRYRFTQLVLQLHDVLVFIDEYDIPRDEFSRQEVISDSVVGVLKLCNFLSLAKVEQD